MSLQAPDNGWVALLDKAAQHWHAQTGLALPAQQQLERLAPLLDRVATWTRRVDLTAARDAETLVDLYLVDALVVNALLPRSCGSVVDVGSGGGAPGLSLALMRPETKFVLVEPRAKRVAFLRTSATELECKQVEVRRARSEELGPREFQVALSRATLAPAEWVREGARIAERNIWLFLANADPPALSGWDVQHDVSYSLPFGGAARRAVCLVRADVG